MSTFNGIVSEFPDIRIDNFRITDNKRPPLACFLSHVHSDHLTGLASLRSPFVYCSSATREILLRLEKYHSRLNFSKGILECREWDYRRLKPILKPLPLETPTTIELSPGNSIRVTLFDANHCVGAVMFLIEGNGKAILYSGDIRAETWWVNSLVQNPTIVPYTLPSRRLDCIYLDTTFATKSKPYREFPSKLAGISELLEKVDKYPTDTIFYFHSWTFGYENVWIALSSFLQCQIHLDRYRWRLYKSLAVKDGTIVAKEAPALCGFVFGNHFNPGCLTDDHTVRLHSCERGMSCPVMDGDANVVHIVPIVTRSNGSEIGEIGAGGGKGDLDQAIDLETRDAEVIGRLMQVCAEKIEDPDLLSRVLELLQSTIAGENATLSLQGDVPSQILEGEIDSRGDDLPLQTLISILSSHVSSNAGQTRQSQTRRITFPYSRHSSYSELRTLVEALQPKDVYPCTVDRENWNPELSMRSLFGDLCSEDTFTHDEEMMEMYEEREERLRSIKRRLPEETQTTEDSSSQVTAVWRGDNGQDGATPTGSSDFHTAPMAPQAVIDLTAEDMGVQPPQISSSCPIDLTDEDMHDEQPPSSTFARVAFETSFSAPPAPSSLSKKFGFTMDGANDEQPPISSSPAPLQEAPSSPPSPSLSAMIDMMTDGPYPQQHPPSPSPSPAPLQRTPSPAPPTPSFSQLFNENHPGNTSTTAHQPSLPGSPALRRYVPPSSAPVVSDSLSSDETDGMEISSGARSKTQRLAYKAALGLDGLSWEDFGGLMSARSRGADEEVEL